MPIDFTNLPDKAQAKVPSQGGVDMSGLPDKSPSDESHNHPYLAALTRLLGGVGSAIASPADVTVLGSAIPAAISGGSESLAEYLEGSPQSAARIGTEAAIGAVPFAKLVKSGRMVANMGKAAVLGGVGEGAREKAKGEDLSLGQIGGSAALNAATYGLFHKFLGGGGGGGKTPEAPYEVVPTSQTGEGTSVIAKAGKGKTSKIVRSGPIAAPPSITPSGENISVARGPVEPDMRAAIPGTTDVAAYGGPAAKSQKAESVTAERARVAAQKVQDAEDKANRIKDEREGLGLKPKSSFSESENGVDEEGKRVSKSTRFSKPKDEEGGDGVPNGAGNGPESPLDALERRLGMKEKAPLEDSLYTNPQPHAPWGGAVIPNLDQYLVGTAQKAIDEGNAANVGGLPVLGTPSVHVPSVEPSPVEALKKVLSPRPSRSVKTVEGFNRALGKRIEAGGLPGDAPVVPQDAPGAVIGDTNIPAPSPDVNVAPEPTSDQIEAMAENRGLPPQGRPPSATHPYEINEVGGKLGVFDTSKAGSKPLLITDNPDEAESLIRTLTQAKNVTPSAPESPLLKILKTRQGATGANYRAAKDAAKRGEIPSADYARDSHLVELGKEPEGPFAGPPAPRTPGQTIDQLLDAQGIPRTAPVEGGMVEPQPTGNPDAGAAGASEAPDWVRKANEELEAMKKDPSQRGGIAPGLLRLLTTGTGAAIGAPVGSYLDPEDPNASTKGAIAGAALGFAGAKGPQELINWRNAGLLATPSAQMKKPLSDLGAYIGRAAESAMSGKFNSETAPMMREMFNPKNISNYVKGFKDPRLAEDVIGDSAKPYIEPAKGLMGLVARPFAGAQYATSQAMQRAGITPEEARDTLLLGTPKAELWKRWLDLQKLPGWQGQAVRAVRPFARIGTNLFERGWERIPGISMMTGDPETRMARTVLGTGALAAGALTGHGDAQDMEQGGYEASPIVRGLRRALLASYGVPFMVGEAMTGPAGIRDLVYMTPGATQTVPVPAPKDTFGDYGKKIGKRWLDQMMPDWLVPQDWEAKPQR